MNKLRMLHLSDVDVHRNMVHVRQGKGKKDRFVVLAGLIADKLEAYLNQVKPKVFFVAFFKFALSS